MITYIVLLLVLVIIISGWKILSNNKQESKKTKQPHFNYKVAFYKYWSDLPNVQVVADIPDRYAFLFGTQFITKIETGYYNFYTDPLSEFIDQYKVEVTEQNAQTLTKNLHQYSIIYYNIVRTLSKTFKEKDLLDKSVPKHFSVQASEKIAISFFDDVFSLVCQGGSIYKPISNWEELLHMRVENNSKFLEQRKSEIWNDVHKIYKVFKSIIISRNDQTKLTGILKNESENILLFMEFLEPMIRTAFPDETSDKTVDLFFGSLEGKKKDLYNELANQMSLGRKLDRKLCYDIICSLITEHNIIKDAEIYFGKEAKFTD